MAWIYADEEQADGFKWAAYSMYPSELLSFLQVSESTENATVVVSHDPGCSKAISKLVNNRKLASTM